MLLLEKMESSSLIYALLSRTLISTNNVATSLSIYIFCHDISIAIQINQDFIDLANPNT